MCSMINLFHVDYMKLGHFTENGDWGKHCGVSSIAKPTVNGLRLETDRHICTNDACECAFKRYMHSRNQSSKIVPDK